MILGDKLTNFEICEILYSEYILLDPRLAYPHHIIELQGKTEPYRFITLHKGELYWVKK